MSEEISKQDSHALRFQTIYSESDRGTIIAGASLLDDILRNLIYANMQRTEADTEHQLNMRSSIFDAEKGGSLANYHPKCQIAYAMGWITKEMYDSLRLIGKVRNRAAHDCEHFSFQSDDVVKILFKIPRIYEEYESKDDLCEVGVSSQRLFFNESEIEYTMSDVVEAKIAFVHCIWSLSEELLCDMPH